MFECAFEPADEIGKIVQDDGFGMAGEFHLETEIAQLVEH